MNDFELTQTILAERQKIDPNTRRQFTYAVLAKKYSRREVVSTGLIWKMINIRGYIVKDEEARISLGLSPMKRVPANLETYDPAIEATYTPATHAVVPLAQPAINGSERKASKPRIAISKQDMQSAARTIINNLDFSSIVELYDTLGFHIHMHPDELAQYEVALETGVTVAKAGMGLEV